MEASLAGRGLAEPSERLTSGASSTRYSSNPDQEIEPFLIRESSKPAQEVPKPDTGISAVGSGTRLRGVRSPYVLTRKLQTKVLYTDGEARRAFCAEAYLALSQTDFDSRSTATSVESRGRAQHGGKRPSTHSGGIRRRRRCGESPAPIRSRNRLCARASCGQGAYNSAPRTSRRKSRTRKTSLCLAARTSEVGGSVRQDRPAPPTRADHGGGAPRSCRRPSIEARSLRLSPFRRLVARRRPSVSGRSGRPA